jgi:2-keto-4-pentenoate hydratase/2-oxohepta-3-ene-1,7-dioic acid hydratase in catechol pathway
MKPCRPSFVPRKFVGKLKENGQGLPAKLAVNGELMIDGNTADMMWTPQECLAEISKIATLEPGDMVFTGTPSGSVKSHRQRWLKVGDRIQAEIGELGILEV